MNYELEIEKSFPAVFEPFTGTRPPLVAGSGSALLINSTPTTLAFNAFVKDRENSEFTLECWYLPVNVNGTVVIMGHINDGLIFDGTKFSISVPHVAETIESSWTPTELKSFHLVLTYDTETFILYANGDPVIEVDRGLGSWTNTQTQISFNRPIAATSASAVYDSGALYYRVLALDEIQNHYSWGKLALAAERVSAARGGNPYTLSYEDVDVTTSVKFDQNNWDAGFATDLSTETNLLTETTGTWTTSIPLESLSPTTTAGVHLTVVGLGFTIEYSTNGTSWTTTANKRTILEDASTTDKVLDIRITLIDVNSWIESVTVDVLGSRVMNPYRGSRVLWFSGAAMDQTPGHQLDYHADQGAQIKAGYIEVQPDATETPESITTIEAWIKFDSTSGWVLAATGSNFVSLAGGSLTSTGVTTYINGTAGSTVVSGQWNHFVFVFTSPQTGRIRLANNLGGTAPLDMTVGHLATYSTALSAAQALALYQFNVGANIIRVDDVSAIRVTESVPSTSIYAYNWSIVPASS